MTFATIRIDIDGRGVATLELARTAKHNALDARMIAELTAAAAVLGSDAAVRVVVITGSGPTFCAGGDLEWMREQFTGTRDERIEAARALAGMLRALDELPKPLIAAVQGNAYGGGVGLMCVCDCVIAARQATFALTETRLGLIPATIGPYVASRLSGGSARRMMLFPRPFSTEEALVMGLVHIISEPSGLAAAVEAECAACLQALPHASASAKALARNLRGAITDDVVAQSIAGLADTWERPEAQRAVAAFLDRKADSR